MSGTLSPDAKRGALLVGAELGVTYGIPTLRMLYQLMVDLDAAAQAVRGMAERLGGTVGGVGGTLASAGLGVDQVAAVQADLSAIRAKSPAAADLALIARLTQQVREIDVGWVV